MLMLIIFRGSGNNNCSIVPAGSYSLQGMSTYISCDKGTYSSIPNQPSCNHCAAGKVIF